MTDTNTANQRIQQEIRQRNAKFEELYSNRKFDDLLEFYTEDCRYMLPGRDVIEGRKGVKNAKLNEDLVDVGAARISLQSDEIVETGTNTAVERGHYTLVRRDGGLFDRGKYMVLWKKINRIWYMHFEIFNSNLRS